MMWVWHALRRAPLLVVGVLCGCFLPIYSGRQVRWMYVPAGVTQEEGDPGFLIHLPSSSAVHPFIFLTRRIQSFLSLADRQVEFCVLTI